MPDLLLELFSEEIPARMQPRAMEDLKKLVTDRLVEAGLVYEGAKAFATPRRIALSVHGIPAKQKDIREERKGPRRVSPRRKLPERVSTSPATVRKSFGVMPCRNSGALAAGNLSVNIIASRVLWWRVEHATRQSQFRSRREPEKWIISTLCPTETRRSAAGDFIMWPSAHMTGTSR
jgi:hypothetical protein